VITHAVSDIVFLSKLTHEAVNKFCLQFKPGDTSLDRKRLIDPQVKELLANKFASREPAVSLTEWFETWDNEKFVNELKLMYPSDQSTNQQPLLQRIQGLTLSIDIRNPAVTEASLMTLVEVES
jgi:hypothetical protein